MKIKTKILGTFSLLLALALLYQSVSYLLTSKSSSYLKLMRSEINERTLTLEARHLYVQENLALTNLYLYPRKDNMDQFAYADKSLVGKLNELNKQLRDCGDPAQFAFLKTIEDKDGAYSREAAQFYKAHRNDEAPRKAGAARLKDSERFESAVRSAFEEFEKETLGRIKDYGREFSLHDRLRSTFPSLKPIIESRDRLVAGVLNLRTDVELANTARLMSIASRRFLLTGDDKYVTEYKALGTAFVKVAASGVSSLAKNDMDGRKAFADAVEYSRGIVAAFGDTVKYYRSGDITGAEKSLLHSYLNEQMLDSVIEDRYTGDLKSLEEAYASFTPVTEYAIFYNRQLLDMLAASALLMFLAGFFLINRMVKPINDLRDASRRISIGDWSQRVPVRTHDEIGDMATSFNAMASGLEMAEKALLKSHSDLSVLYRISSTINGTVEMEEMLKGVLDAVTSLEVFSLDKKGGIFLVEGEEMRLVSHLGHPAEFLEAHKQMKVGACLCGLAARTGEVVVSCDSSTDERHTIRLPGMHPHGHIIVPLKAKEKVTGVMYLYAAANTVYSEDKINLLTSIGNQLGIAIDNARFYKETKELALHDSLTGLANRRLMDVFLEKNFAGAKRTGTVFSVVMADIDYFKKYNDNNGHLAGDRLLAAVSGLISREAREMDLAVRYGGEEFLILLPDTGLAHAKNVAERVRAAVETSSTVTISLGVAVYDPGMKTPEEVIKAADTALYTAKETGRNRVVVFTRPHLRAA